MPEELEDLVDRFESAVSRLERIVMGWKLLPPAAKQRLRRRAAARARAAKEVGSGKGALGSKAAKKAKTHPDLRLPNPEDEYDV